MCLNGIFEYLIKFRFELRLRYFPESLDAFVLDKPTFGFFYEQVEFYLFIYLNIFF